MSVLGQIGPQILVLGESHANAIARAAAEAEHGDIAAIDVRNRGDAIAREGKVNFAAFAGYRPEHLVLAFGGTEHNIVGLIEVEPKFDFLYPPREELDPQRVMIPAAMIEAMIARQMKSALARAKDVLARFSCPAHFLAPPPPFREIDEKTKFPSAFKSLLSAGIVPPSLRLKLYGVQCAMMRRAYAELGVPMIAAPAESRDADGYLLRGLWNSEPTHGNVVYGRLVLANLRKTLNG